MICKLNDLAYIKKALRPANVGRIVSCKELLGYFIKGESFKWNGEMFQAFDTDYYWVIECKMGLETLYGSSIQAYSPDSWLFPIRGDFEELSTETADELEEENEFHV